MGSNPVFPAKINKFAYLFYFITNFIMLLLKNNHFAKKSIKKYLVTINTVFFYHKQQLPKSSFVFKKIWNIEF